MSKLFIIEDDSNILYGLQSQFSSDGFEVETSEGDEDIETLIERMRDFSPEYIISDFLLPQIDGFELVKQIKSDDSLADIPVFIFTDLSDEDSRVRGDELGVEHYFLKDDFQVYEFADKVKKIIGNHSKIKDTDGGGIE